MIFDWLFKKSKKSNNKEAIAPVFVDTPTREDLIKDGKTKELELLDQYKKEYKDKLNKRLLFGDISSENLSKKYLANQDIIIKHIMSNNYTGINEILASGNTEELLEAKLEYLKLYILNEENNKIYNEMLLRYMALTEIKKKAYFIRPTQRRAISNELDFLHSSLVVCKSNNFATNTDCKLYLIRMNEINKYINNLSEGEKELLDRKKRLIVFLSSRFIKNKYETTINSNMSKMGIVAYLSMELDKYLYDNQRYFKSSKRKYNNFIDSYVSEFHSTESLLKKIEKFEVEYLLLNECHYITTSELEELYKFKFGILIRDLNNLNEVLLEKNDFGFQYYLKILNGKIKNIIDGNNSVFNNTFKYYEKEAIEIIKYIFSSKNELDILHNKELLQLLLSFDIEDGFSKMLYNRKTPGYHMNNITLYDSVPTSTMYEIAYLNNQNNGCYEYKLYCLKRDSEEKQGIYKEYKLPEGIRKIYFGNYDFPFEKDKFASILKNKIFVIPSYIEKIKGYNLIVSMTKNNSIIFDDYKNSRLLYSYELRALLYPFCKIKKGQIKKWYTTEKYRICTYREAFFGREHYETKTRDIEHFSYSYRAFCTIDTITFRGDNDNVVIKGHELRNKGKYEGEGEGSPAAAAIVNTLNSKLNEKKDIEETKKRIRRR